MKKLLQATLNETWHGGQNRVHPTWEREKGRKSGIEKLGRGEMLVKFSQVRAVP